MNCFLGVSSATQPAPESPPPAAVTSKVIHVSAANWMHNNIKYDIHTISAADGANASTFADHCPGWSVHDDNNDGRAYTAFSNGRLD